ncbi:Protein NipSnap [Eumeta japonica]|uniref:Protein NipSnap n=1 Tax=Eumeta variegata TaxID=151549 RepID=A0A4C1ULF4_EUMVA|nr:Protein NipSnap [Eumeta japonica]
MTTLNRVLCLSTVIPKNTRLISTTASRWNADDGWLSKLLVRKIEPTKESHSRMLSDKEIVFALHTHNIRPDSVDKYLKNYKTSVEFVHSQKSELGCELVGSWTVSVGDMDQALHLWRYVGGFEKIDKAKILFKESPEYQALEKERGNFVRSRHLQYLLKFSFWPDAEPRPSKNIYEIRSYSRPSFVTPFPLPSANSLLNQISYFYPMAINTLAPPLEFLKPGTMIEWGNNWARGLSYRRSQNEAFAGYFSQIGRLYNVHHIWCYKNLQARRETRESTWRNPGWDECVAYTVPLIREMHCRILEPTEFSPTQ